ncbi:hypothetical protein Acr_28g0007730 [Actinidia rufa]|uniref:CCHC-type domain-containing protein n=1 Tax=Actinidia rufa TaxID=165716 RepID=A0A7J0HAL8_9ERIC|nr:hypothetical protein Acr_28g0007730 [Actinidia rufa]
MKAFLQLRPPTFKGEPDPLVVEDWLEQVTRALDTILVIEEDLRVLFASYQLQRDALQWWKTMEEVREWDKQSVGGRSSKKPRNFTAQQQYPASGLPTEGSATAVAAGGTISYSGTGQSLVRGPPTCYRCGQVGHISRVHAEGEQSGSYGIATTYSVSSGLEGYSSVYISTDFISVQATGCSSAGSEDAGTGLRYDVSSGTVGDSWTAGAAIGYLCCARYFTYV